MARTVREEEVPGEVFEERVVEREGSGLGRLLLTLLALLGVGLLIWYFVLGGAREDENKTDTTPGTTTEKQIQTTPDTGTGTGGTTPPSATP